MRSAGLVSLTSFGRYVSIAVALGVIGSVVRAQAVQNPAAGVHIQRAHPAGLATFVTGANGGAIPVQSAAGGQINPADFLRQHGHLFGVTNPATQLVERKRRVDSLGQAHFTFQQLHQGVRVFSGVLKVHQAPDGTIRAANGRFYPIRQDLLTVPTLAEETAIARARGRIQNGNPNVAHTELVIVDPGWYGDPPIGAHLAYYIILEDSAIPLREAFFVDAHKGRVLDQWTLIETLLDREVLDLFSGDPVRSEGDPPTGVFDEDAAYDYSGDFYNYLSRGFGRDSYDDASATLVSGVHRSSSCPNASWNGLRTSYCDGVVTDDIVAHEFGHALTQHTAGLIYQNQPGQLNESFSDIWGELVDLFNGDAAFPGAPGGTPWPTPADYVGPGGDLPNTSRFGCTSGAEMEVNFPGDIAGVYFAQSASFGPLLTLAGTTEDLVVADPIRGCDVDVPFNNGGAMTSKIVVIERGDCTFAEKVLNAQDEGAIAVIIYNNVAGGPAPMGGSDPAVTIPSVGLTLADGELVRDRAAIETVNVTLRSSASDSSIRWLVGEDSTAFGGAIRDMWQPSCAGDPDTANHPFQICHPNDNGGVHSGSGVPNHAFAIMVDGKNFNGYSVNAIGPIKAGAVWYRAVATYLTDASNFQDAYNALNQAAADLTGQLITDPRDGVTTVLFTANDAVEVDKALQAVEMNTDGLCGSWKTVVDATPPPGCRGGTVRSSVYFDDFESGPNGWTVFNSNPPSPYDWVQVAGGLPEGRSGTVWFIDDRNVGNCLTQDESATHTLESPVIATPAIAGSLMLSFVHFVGTETFYDGGNVSLSVNGGAWAQIPSSAIVHNSYNNTLAFAPDNTNPMAGQEAWTGYNLEPGDWGTTQIDLSAFASGGDDVQFRFDFGKDGCFGIDGWYVDDFELFVCEESLAPIPAVSTWGLGIMLLLILSAGTVMLRRYPYSIQEQ